MSSNNKSASNTSLSVNLLPAFYQTNANKKFLQSTIDQLFQPGSVTKNSGYIGRQNAKAAINTDIYVKSADSNRQNYQLEPGLSVTDALGNVTFFKDYIDYINQLNVFGGNTKNHERLNKQEFYSWDPHIDWDKFVNFQNYYWLSYGPESITIYGEQQKIISTYTVEIQNEGDTVEYLFTPDGLKLNPTLKLYRGQTYIFEINSPGNPFSFMTQRDIGGETRYRNAGIDNAAVEVGTITFTVPSDAPSILFYQSETNINLGGVLEIYDIKESTIFDVANSILGKKNYVLPDGTKLSNGMKIAFGGQVTPASYATDQYYVEGVGTAIKLVPAKILEIISQYTVSESIQFDTLPFDREPFDDANGYATTKDYIVINRASRDHNPWSRYNRWFHKDVITESAKYNNTPVSLDQTARATRPIIEFEADLKLFNMGTTAVLDVDLIDTYTDDVFSIIEGSRGYNVDGVPLTAGQLILFTADPDPLVKDKIYRVGFVDVMHLNNIDSRQITLTEVSTPVLNQVTLVKFGNKNQGQMYWYNGTNWIKGQYKSDVNQSPLFDVFDTNGISYSDSTVYNGSSFAGTKIFSYQQGSGNNDSVLGFPLSYLNVANIGDIVFSFNLATDTFEYKKTTAFTTVQLSVGYLSSMDFGGNTKFVNGWQHCNVNYFQPAIRTYTNSGLTNNFNIDIFDTQPTAFNTDSKLDQDDVRVYVNSNRVAIDHWSLVTTLSYYQVVFKTPVALTDVVTIKVFSPEPINNNGFYEIPLNLQNNPLNDSIGTFTLGEVSDHVNSIIDNIYNPESGNDASDIDNLKYDQTKNDIAGVTYIGVFPGTSNLRDLGNITQYGTKFVQHSGPLSLALYHITSQENNIVHAIEKSRDDYNNFKRIFLATAGTLGIDSDPISMVDLILQKINKNKPKTSPYYFSDMVPYGAALITMLDVVDSRITQYPLTATFSLDTLSSKAVGVYHVTTALNTKIKTQLVYEQDYNFNNLGYVTILPNVLLTAGDQIITYEYDSTDGCFIPETPTKMGIWPAYVPQIYTDNTFLIPKTVIQGHDGSQILAYGDYRDDLILELEKRIYNNIKVKYDPSIFDIYSIIPGYSRTTDYTLSEFNQVLSTNFYKWTGFIGVDFSQQTNYDAANSFTYNYTDFASPNGYPVPGFWRGVYRWLLDTERPNLCPWEMLGFSRMPTWWTTVYGPAPYTSDNLVMWRDISGGIVREPGKPVVVLTKFVRPFLIDHIPVDESGNLVSPLISGVVTGPITADIKNNFVFGDVGPVESAWRRGSHYPFSVLITAMLLSPAKIFGLILDRSRIVRNNAGQLVYKDTGLRVRPQDIVLPSVYSSTQRVQTAGIINYIVNFITGYVFNNSVDSYDLYKSNLATMGIQLSYRVGAFTNKSQFNLLLDSKTPLSSGSVFIPAESYNIILNKSSTVKKLTYSGVIITKLSTGFEVKGYSKSQPYFYYYNYIKSGSTINVGGISASYVNWATNEQYNVNSIVKYLNVYYTTLVKHTSTDVFQPGFFAPVTNGLPFVGGVSAQLRSMWDRTDPIAIPYGTQFPTIQAVVDFLTGYGEWLTDQGFVFDDFNTNLSTVSNWTTSSKEFMFWTTQNWSTGQDKWSEWEPNKSYEYATVVRFNGEYYSANHKINSSPEFNLAQWSLLPGLSTVGSSVISLSPAANGITFNTNLTVVDNINNQFNDYEIFKVDGTPILPATLDSYRDNNTITYTCKNNDGIYSASFYLIQNEHVVLINNTDIFNDVIYNPPSGYRRDRIKISGYITNGWNGGLDIPGFIFDAATVETWQPWKDYNMGDIVNYQGYYYSAIAFTAGTSDFNFYSWSKLSKQPTPQLLPNWTNVATQFVDFYNTDVDGFDTAQKTMAHHLIGYQQRQYLDNIIQDPVSEFKFYQGMIRNKGTQNVLNSLFNTLGADGDASLTFYEEWALRVGQYGASNAFENIELILDDGKFRSNPQGILLVNSIDKNIDEFICQQTPNDIYVKPLGYTSNPFPVLENPQSLLRSAGYINKSDVLVSLGNLSDILAQDITKFVNGSYVWCAFANKPTDWNVYRFSDTNIRVTDVTCTNGKLTITSENIIQFNAGDYIGISQVELLHGFYQVLSVNLNAFTVATTLGAVPAPFTQSSELVIYSFTTQRATTIDTIDSILPHHLIPGELLWTDDRGDGKWATWTYNPIYEQSVLLNTSPQANLTYGSTLAVNSQSTISAIGNSLGQIITHDKVGISIPWTQRQLIQSPFISQSGVLANPLNTLSTIIAISDDGTWLAAGSPAVGYVSTFADSRNSGNYNSAYTYAPNVVVFVTANSTYYQSLTAVPVNTPPATSPTYWESIPYVAVSTSGTNSSLVGQGAVSLYSLDANNIYTLVDTIVSPHPAANENFGASLVFGDNILYIGATGSTSNTGKVYKLKYSTTTNVTVSYNPVGSEYTTLIVSSTSGIRTGMQVQGTGFTKNQTVIGVLSKLVVADATGIIPGMVVSGNGILAGEYVVSVVGTMITVSGVQDVPASVVSATFSNATTTVTVAVQAVTSLHTLNLDSVPDELPAGLLKFVSTGWSYDWAEIYTGTQTNSNFGSVLSLSNDNNTLAISASGNQCNGQVFVYTNTGSGLTLSQTLTGIDNQFGASVTISNIGEYLAISDSTTSTSTFNDVGSVSVYKNINGTYVLYQSLIDHYQVANAKFGAKIAFMNDYKSIAVYSQNGDTYITTTFDNDETIFDNKITEFITAHPSSGRVDVYDRYNNNWVYSESMPTTNQQLDGYGLGFAVGNDHIMVSAPYAMDQDVKSGLVYDYTKMPNTYTWQIYRTEVQLPDVKKIKKAFLYNKMDGTLIKYLDVIDPLQGKIAGPADEEIRYKTFYDPAVYTYTDGTVSVTKNENAFWSKSELGQVWWNLSTTKFVDPYVNDVSYRTNTWNVLAPGASVDICEWVASSLLPAQWDVQSKTATGLANGISGQTLYGNSAYSIRKRYNNITKQFTNTYYYWVKNKATIPNREGRNMSAQSVAELISNPRGSSYSYLALTGLNSVSLTNVTEYLKSTNVVLSIEYWTIDKTDQNIHTQWSLISNDTIVNLPKNIEQKWFDSLCGVDSAGREVPDTALPPKLRYGVENRPRQGMFVNRIESLKEFIEHVNSILITNQISESYNLTNIESYDNPPSTITGLYDTVLDVTEYLAYANINSYTKPSVTPIITDGKITGITILSSGKGYLVAPYIEIHGSGMGAVVRSVINTLGQITGATIENSGAGYNSNTTCSIRNYSVLISNDSGANGNWSIYNYDPDPALWSRSITQAYDVRKYWYYTDWFATGYNQFSAADFLVSTFVDLNTITPTIGELVKVTSVNAGGWLLLEKYAESSSVDWTQTYNVVGIQNGTIQFSKLLYEFANTDVGYDSSIFDDGSFDLIASTELRIILNSIKNDILINDLKQEYLNLFLSAIRYAYSEQVYLDWAFKTSFIRATYNVGKLDQPVNYPVDNLSNFQDYIAEVKPYRTKIREYISNYTGMDVASPAITDFDLQPVYKNNKIIPVNTYVQNGSVVAYEPEITQYPWKFWLDNVGFEIIEIVITSGGSGYIIQPQIIITSDSGSGAVAKAFFTNGVINRIILISAGSGYLSAPTITINGGLNVGGVAATAVAIIGNSVIRTNLIGLRFDRTTQTYLITDITNSETFTGTGSKLQFTLQWGPDIRVGKSNVTINGVPVLRETYKLAVASSKVNGYTKYSGTITFTTPPISGNTIVVNYIKDITLLNAADRIQYYYNPTFGQLGKDLAQLMTGIDYGGVQVNGLGFTQTSGWGAVPYGNIGWDVYDSTYNDYVVTVNENTHSFTLPYVPTAGTEINIYYVQNKGVNYTSDGSKLTYTFDINLNYPAVSVTRSIVTTGFVIHNYVTPPANTPVTVIKLDSTTGITVGMGITGTGFIGTYTVLSVDSIAHTVTTNATDAWIPGTIYTAGVVVTYNNALYRCITDNAVSTFDITQWVLLTPSGAITFITNGAGKNVLKLASVAGIKVGDVVTTSDVTAFAYNTVVTLIDTLTNTITLNQVMFKTVPVGSTIVFSRKLNVPLDTSINANGFITLTSPITSGSIITISGTLDVVRLDDPAYETINQSNINAIISTPIADGLTSTFEIPSTFVVNNGDKFILRQSTSDGSLIPSSNDYDTAITGGNFTYNSATGLLADDIVIDGDGFVTPTSSPAPEEVVPGQVVDTLAIKVFDAGNTGSANIKVDSYITDGVLATFGITQRPNSPRAVIVKLGSDIKTYSTDYTIDYVNKNIIFNTVPTQGQVISIFSIGFNGSGILDLDYFVGDGNTTEFVTRAPWVSSLTSLIYQDGLVVTPELFKTDDTYSLSNVVGIRFPIAPTAGSLINYLIVSGNQQTFSITKTEKIATNGGLTYTLEYPIGNALPNETSMLVRVDQNMLSGPNNSYFTIGSNKLSYTVDPTQFLPNSVNITDINVLVSGNILTFGTDYTIDPSGITIKINKSTYKKYTGQQLVVSIIVGEGYTFNPITNQITFKQSYDNTHTVEVISSYVHDILNIERTAVTVTTTASVTPDTVAFYTYRAIVSGEVILSRTVLSDYYVWVMKNQILLVPSIDYKLASDYKSILLAEAPGISDTITVMTFGNNVLPEAGISYMQFKDMLNRVSYKRLSANKRTTLMEDLRWNDKQIVVDDASMFSLPNPAQNKPGVVEIRGERIEYFAISGNTLSRLRRGTLGTGVFNLNKAGTYVQDIGPSETVPYQDTTITQQVISDGTNIVKVDFVPSSDAMSIYTWFSENGYTFTGNYETVSYYNINNVVVYNNSYYYTVYPIPAVKDRLATVDYSTANSKYWKLYDTTIPPGYSQSNEIEVFVGGYNDSAIWASGVEYNIGDIVHTGAYTYSCIVHHTSSKIFNNDLSNWKFFIGNIRLKKAPYKVFNVNNAPYSPAGDVHFDADFAVDGTHKQIRLTTAVPVGTQISVIQQTGISWDNSINLLNDNSKIATFIKASPGIWYSPYDNKYLKQSTTSGQTTFDSSTGTFDNGNITFDQG